MPIPSHDARKRNDSRALGVGPGTVPGTEPGTAPGAVPGTTRDPSQKAPNTNAGTFSPAVVPGTAPD